MLTRRTPMSNIIDHGYALVFGHGEPNDDMPPIARLDRDGNGDWQLHVRQTHDPAANGRCFLTTGELLEVAAWMARHERRSGKDRRADA